MSRRKIRPFHSLLMLHGVIVVIGGLVVVEMVVVVVVVVVATGETSHGHTKAGMRVICLCHQNFVDIFTYSDRVFCQKLCPQKLGV